MPTAATESSPTTALAALAAKAASEPEEPWLFYRRGWDWHWRSWGQAADQVARGAEALADAEPGVGFRPVQDPDAVALALAIQAAGRALTPTLSPTSIPECRSRLERWQPRALDLDAAPPVFLRDLFREAERFDGKIPAVPDRLILCATPALAARDFQVVLAWTLRSGAAWVLEPESEAFLETVLWVRPSVVMATGAELERLAAAMAGRKHRRQSRLEVTVDVEKRPLTPVPSAHPI
ncbi:MAG: hypothetical protein V3T72_05270 [Thermoanaerobaculia bacterium]